MLAQVLPVQRQISALVAVADVYRYPVAHAAPPGANTTELNPEFFGALTAAFCQVFPVHRILSGTEDPLPPKGPVIPLPTANAIRPGPAATPLRDRWLPPLNGKEVSVVQVLPFHRARTAVGMPWLV